jgi:hypothetical protein
MMDTYKITAYDKETGIAVVTFKIGGTTYTGVKVASVPKDSVESVTAYMRKYVDAYMAGKAQEAEAKADIPLEVKALLNVATEF